MSANYGRMILSVVPALLASCVYSQHPLSDEETSTLDERLLGTWAAVDEPRGLSETKRMTIGRKPGTKRTLEWVSVDLTGENTVKVHRQTVYARTGKHNYLSIEQPLKEGKIAYLICKYDFPAEGAFRLFIPDQDFIGKAVEEGKLRGKVEYRDDTAPEADCKNREEKPETPEDDASGTIQSVYLTDSPERILEFLDQNSDKSFTGPGLYVKVSSSQ